MTDMIGSKRVAVDHRSAVKHKQWKLLRNYRRFFNSHKALLLYDLTLMEHGELQLFK